MARGTNKKQRHQRKRHDRKRALQRARARSPYRVIGASGATEACYVNRRWHETGLANIYCLRTVPGGGHAMAAFLVDIWCIGLKDAWGHLDITAARFNEQIIERGSDALELVRVDHEVAVRLVAGGIRFAKQNCFRLPRRYERWTAMLGVSDADSADLSDFGHEGGLTYIGAIEDLESRLIDCSVDEFFAREDVHFVIGVGDAPLVDEDMREVGAITDEMRDRFLDGARQWCFARSIKPHPELPAACDILIESLVQVDSYGDDDEPSDEGVGKSVDNVGRLLSFESGSAREDLYEAMDQLKQFVGQFETPEAMFRSMGFDPNAE